jgi:hypothetical protein
MLRGDHKVNMNKYRELHMGFSRVIVLGHQRMQRLVANFPQGNPDIGTKTIDRPCHYLQTVIGGYG